MNVHGEYFVTAGDRTLKTWRINTEGRKIHGIDVEVGKLKRLINCIVVDEKDEIIYCGTSSGDIIKARSESIITIKKKFTISICLFVCYLLIITLFCLGFFFR